MVILPRTFFHFPLLTTGDGYITTDVLREIMKELDPKLTSEDLDNIIDEVDEDGSGTVDFDGMFKQWLINSPRRYHCQRLSINYCIT